MERLLIIVACLLCFNACHNLPIKTEIECDLLSYLKDSIHSFRNVEEIEVNGHISNETIDISYYSIPAGDFLSKMRENKEHIRFFNRDIKINENKSVYGVRFGNALKVGDGINYIYLVDLEMNQYHHARNFFLEGQLGSYYIIKRIQFEDYETIIWNSVTGKEELYLSGVSTIIHPVDSLIFYSRPMVLTLLDNSFQLNLFRINSGKIDILMDTCVEWFTSFAFFDKESNSIYYLHHFLENYELKSTYARMDIKFH